MRHDEQAIISSCRLPVSSLRTAKSRKRLLLMRTSVPQCENGGTKREPVDGETGKYDEKYPVYAGYKNEVRLNACHAIQRGTTLCFSFLMVLSIALMTPRHDTHSQDKRKKQKKGEESGIVVSQSFESGGD